MVYITLQAPYNITEMSVETQGIELGKSLAKILLSDKYKDYNVKDCINILIIARVKAQELLEQENLHDSVLTEEEKIINKAKKIPESILCPGLDGEKIWSIDKTTDTTALNKNSVSGSVSEELIRRLVRDELKKILENLK